MIFEDEFRQSCGVVGLLDDLKFCNCIQFHALLDPSSESETAAESSLCVNTFICSQSVCE